MINAEPREIIKDLLNKHGWHREMTIGSMKATHEASYESDLPGIR